MKVDRKKRKEKGNICKGTSDIEFEQDWSLGLGATLRDRQKINYFSGFKYFFREKPIVSYCWVSYVGYYKTTKVHENRRVILEKIKIFKFFLRELPLILRVGRKREKRARDIFKGTPDI